MSFDQQDMDTIKAVSVRMSQGFEVAGMDILRELTGDPRLTPFGVMIGIVQSHIDGIAGTLVLLEPETREELIDSVPHQLRAIIAREER